MISTRNSRRRKPCHGALRFRAPRRFAARSTASRCSTSTCTCRNAPQTLLAGFFGKLDYAIIEATDVTRDGRVYLTTSIGASPTYLRYADRVFIEINNYHSKRLPEMADIVVLSPPPRLDPIPIHDPLTKIGYPYAVVDPKKDHRHNRNQRTRSDRAVSRLWTGGPKALQTTWCGFFSEK